MEEEDIATKDKNEMGKKIEPKKVSPQTYDKIACEKWLKENQIYPNNIFL